MENLGYLKTRCDDANNKGLSKPLRALAARDVMAAIREFLNDGKQLPTFLSDYLVEALEKKDQLALGFKEFNQGLLDFVYAFKVALMVRLQQNYPDPLFDGDSYEYVAQHCFFERTKVYEIYSRWKIAVDGYEKKYGLKEMPSDETLRTNLGKFLHNLKKGQEEDGWHQLEQEYGVSKVSFSSYSRS